MLRVVRCVDIVLFPIHPEGEGLPLEAAVSLKDGHNSDPVALGEDPLRGKADRVGFYQLPGGVVHGIIGKSSHWVHLEPTAMTTKFNWETKCSKEITKHTLKSRKTNSGTYGHIGTTMP